MFKHGTRVTRRILGAEFRNGAPLSEKSLASCHHNKRCGRRASGHVEGGRSIANRSDAERVPKKGCDDDKNKKTGWNGDRRYEPLNHDQSSPCECEKAKPPQSGFAAAFGSDLAAFHDGVDIAPDLRRGARLLR